MLACVSRSVSWICNLRRLLLLTCLLGAGAVLPAQGLSASGAEGLSYAMSLWGDAFKGKTPGFSLEVRTGGEAQAMEELAAGTTQMAMVARDVSPEELSAFNARWGYLPTKVAVAMDALIVVVSKDNPLEAIHIGELDAIYTVNRAMGWPREILTWGDLGVRDPKWASRAIMRYGRTPDSSVFGLIAMYFPHRMLPRMPIRFVADGMAMAEALADNPDGICMANLVETFNSVRAVPMYPPGADGAVFPSPETVSSGAYPYSRCLYVYVNKPLRGGLDPAVKAFLAFALSAEGQQLVRAAGQAPLPKDILALNLFKVTDVLPPSNSPIR